MEIKLKFSNIYNNMGPVFWVQNQLELDLACYSKAWVLDRIVVEAYNSYGAIYLSLNDIEEAKMHFQTALE